MSNRIIKANQITLSEEVQLIDVPTKNYFNPVFNPNINHPSDGFSPTPFTSDEEDIKVHAAFNDFVDPEAVIKTAEQEAERIIKEANNEADLIVQRAKLHIEEERELAREEGRAYGFEQGSEEARQQHEQLLMEADRTLLEARKEREAIIESIEPEMVSLIADITEKLIGNTLILCPNVIAYVIKTGVQGITGVSELTVRVSKFDFDEAVNMKDEIMQYVDSDTVVSIVKDTTLNSGDCVIDTPIGSIDSSIDKQWQTLKNDLFMILRE